MRKILFILIVVITGVTLSLSNFKGSKEKNENSVSSIQIDRSSYSDSLNVAIYKNKGDVAKLKGDIDSALKYWKMSNYYRSNLYKRGNYHLAWNYALLSNYHYEKINTNLAIIYADSCKRLIQNLSLQEQKEIEIYKLWNILAQSYKQQTSEFSELNFQDNYKKILYYYKQSERFIISNNIDSNSLAETYRLIGNAYNDLMSNELYFGGYNVQNYYNQANLYYDKSTSILKDLHGVQNYELARTYFVQGLLNSYLGSRLDFNSIPIAIKYFEKSLNTYGLNFNQSNSDFITVPNHEDLLMTCKYLNDLYIGEYLETKEKDWLTKAESLNSVSLKIWDRIHKEFLSSNTNQNLSIYGLLPFTHTVAIEILKKENGEAYSEETIFTSIQKLKAFDLVNTANKNEHRIDLVSLKDFQSKLKYNELFVDFQFIDDLRKILVTRITKDSVETITIDYSVIPIIKVLMSSINAQDYQQFISSSYQVYNSLIRPIQINKFDKIILCLDGELHQLPFDALLCSKKNISKNDYRKLDYLVNHKEIEIILNPALFRNHTSKKESLSISAFAPNSAKTFTELPFSKSLITELKDAYNAIVFVDGRATKSKLLKGSNSILHLSGHATINDKDATSSNLILSDKVVSLQDFKSIQQVPKLMVLNTCNSAIGKIYAGDGVDGFVRAAYLRGVPSILTNRWEVDDKASSEMLSSFYHNLAQGSSNYTALRKAKQKYLLEAKNARLAAPYYWAAHKMLGDEVVFEKKKNSHQNWFGIFWLFLIPMLIIGISLLLLKAKKKYS